MTYDELMRSVTQSRRSFPSLGMPGGGSTGSTGTNFITFDETWHFAEITELPDEDHPGYSHEQRIPQSEGGFAEPDEDAELNIKGDNGSTSGIVTSPAFPMNDNDAFEVGDIVKLVRGYQRDLGDGEGQEWLIAGTGGGSGGNCTASCWINLIPSSLTGTLNSTTCKVSVDGIRHRWCGPLCVNSTSCPTETIATLTTADVTGGIATLTTTTGHPGDVADRITLKELESPFDVLNGAQTIVTVPTDSTFTIETGLSDIPSAPTTGDVDRQVEDCTQCVEVYDWTKLNDFTFNPTTCEITKNTTKFLHGCFKYVSADEVDEETGGGLIPFILPDTLVGTVDDTDPDNCTITWEFELGYLCGYLLDLDGPCPGAPIDTTIYNLDYSKAHNSMYLAI